MKQRAFAGCSRWKRSCYNNTRQVFKEDIGFFCRYGK